MKSVFVCRDFDAKAKRRFIKSKYDWLVVLEISEVVDFPRERIISAIDCNEEGSWIAYEYISKTLESFRVSDDYLFTYKNYDFTNAYKKALLWEYYSEGLLLAVLKNLKESHKKLKVVHYRPNDNIKRLKAFLWLLKQRLFGTLVERFEVQENMNAEVLVFVNNQGTLKTCTKIIEQLIYRRIKVGLLARGENSKYIKDLNFSEACEIPLKKSEVKKKVGFSIRSANRDVQMFRSVVRLASEFRALSDLLESVLDHNPDCKTLLVNAMENSWEGHILTEVAHKNDSRKLKVFNTMNGVKFGSANNTDVDFDHWFVWSAGMRNVLETKCYLNRNMFVNIDLHLAQDEIIEHKYSNSIGLKDAQLSKQLKVSLFLPRDYTVAADEVINFIKQQLISDNILIIVRPHPTYRYEERMIEMFENEVENGDVIIIDTQRMLEKKFLFDQLSVSDISIVFGSTVAYESCWFGVPVITYEKVEKSVLPDLDGEFMCHANSVDKLNTLLFSMIKRGKGVKICFPENHVAKSYSDFMLNNMVDDFNKHVPNE